MTDILDKEAVASFCSITGAHPGIAHNYLQIADGQVERAVSLFLDSDGMLLAGSTDGRANSPSFDASGPPVVVGPSLPTVQGRRITIPSGSPEGPNFEGSEDLEDVDVESAGDPDLELARALQAAEERGSGNGVRAPIAPRHETLVGPGNDLYETRFARYPAANASSTFDQRLQHRNRADGSPKARDRLAQLFRPPVDLIHNSTFENARAKAKHEAKWLMINPMDPHEFACQVMNRDLWSDPAVKTVVKESFIFMQVDPTSPVGQKYITFYPVDNYPHVAIIDPRTAERVKIWNVQLSPTEFLMEVTDFLDANSLHNWSASGSTRVNASSSLRRSPSPTAEHGHSFPSCTDAQKAVSDMSEEEQLKAALAASMASNEEASMVAAVICASEEMAAQNAVKSKDKGSGVKGIAPKTNDEPPVGDPNSTRIQIRNSADGSRQVRRFYKTDLVEAIFAFVKVFVPSVNEEEFDLVFHRESLATKLYQTIAEAGLENASITIEAIV